MAAVSFSHVGLMCIDPIATERFYTRHFGFRRTRVYAPGPDQVVMIKAGDIYLELLQGNRETALPRSKGSRAELAVPPPSLLFGRRSRRKTQTDGQ